MMYMGSEGVHSHTFAYQQKEDCPVCTSTVQSMSLPSNTTLNELIHMLRNGSLRLQSPSLTSGSGTTLYMQKPPALEKATRPNLDKPLVDLVSDREEVLVTDPILESINLTVRIQFDDKN